MEHNQRAQAVSKVARIVNQLESKTSFALDPATGEQIFISSKLSQQFGLKIGDDVQLFVIPNEKNPTVAWYAIFVAVIEAGEAASEEDLGFVDQTLIREFLKGGCATTEQIAEHMDVGFDRLETVLRRMYCKSVLATSRARSQVDGVDYSIDLWALDIGDFIPDIED